MMTTKIQESMTQGGDEIINRYTLIAAGVGVIPSPMVNSVGIAVMEIAMIDELAKKYHFDFPTKQALVKAFISLVSSIGPVYIAMKSKSAVSAIPIVGLLLSTGIYSIAGAISVYAVGKIFQRHFESGGQILSMDNAFLQKIFKEAYQEGKEKLPGMISHSTSLVSG